MGLWAFQSARSCPNSQREGELLKGKRERKLRASELRSGLALQALESLRPPKQLQEAVGAALGEAAWGLAIRLAAIFEGQVGPINLIGLGLVTCRFLAIRAHGNSNHSVAAAKIRATCSCCDHGYAELEQRATLGLLQSTAVPGSPGVSCTSLQGRANSMSESQVNDGPSL